MEAVLPQGPRVPSVIQSALLLYRPQWFVRRCQRHFGDLFTLKLATPRRILPGPVVYLADPAAAKRLFAMDGEHAHAGVANQVIGSLAGSHSLLLADGESHLSQRRRLSAALRAEAFPRLKSIARTAVEREIDTWPLDSVFAVRPAMRKISFEVVARGLLGIDDDAFQARLYDALAPLMNVRSIVLASFAPGLFADRACWNPLRNFHSHLDELDRLLLELISMRRHGELLGLDPLSFMLLTRNEEGESPDDRQIRDELVTLLLGGYETTATTLAWALERLAHTPAELAELEAKLGEEGDGPNETLDAVVAETLRVRPVIIDVARRLSADAEVASFQLPAGTTVMPSIYLIHLDPKNYENPDEFRPSRFFEDPPGNLAWLPFGGGRRRCLGAAFARLEIQTVLSAVLASYMPEPASSYIERPRLGGLAYAPEHNARLRMKRRGVTTKGFLAHR